MRNSTFNESNTWPSNLERVREWYWVLRGLVGLVILVGNSAVIYLIVTCRRLHTKPNWFILSLSIADLLVGLILIPVSTSCGLWIPCNVRVLNMSFDLLFFVSVANMCAMTADRYLYVVKPLTYAQTMTKMRVFLLIAGAWLITIVFQLIQLAWIFSQSLGYKQRADSIYGTFQIISFNIVPCVTMLIVYGHILVISRKHSRQIRAVAVNLRTLNLRQAKQESSATKVFGLVVLFFVFCWILSAYRHFCRYFDLPCGIPMGVVIASRILALLHSAINPLIYAFLKEDIKREMKTKMCRERRRNPGIVLPSFQSQKNDDHSSEENKNENG